jgi:hypothetical protein
MEISPDDLMIPNVNVNSKRPAAWFAALATQDMHSRIVLRVERIWAIQQVTRRQKHNLRRETSVRTSDLWRTLLRGEGQLDSANDVPQVAIVDHNRHTGILCVDEHYRIHSASCQAERQI